MTILAKERVQTRRNRAFVPSDAGGMRGMRLEPRSLAAPIFFRDGGTNMATANDNGGQPNQPNSLIVNFDPNNPAASGSSQYAVPQGQGSGAASTSDSASANVGGSGGASGIAVNGQVSGQINGDLAQGVLPFGPAGATVASTDANGNAAPLTWAVGDSDPNETSGNVTVTFQVNGTDGINPNTNVQVGGCFTLSIVTPNLMILMNATAAGKGGNGLQIFENPDPSNPFGWTQVYQDSNSDGSPDGVINYVPPIPGMPGTGQHPQGSASFSGSFSATFPIATTGGAGFAIDYAAGFQEVVRWGQGLFVPGDHVQATPSMQWTFSVTAS